MSEQQHSIQKCGETQRDREESDTSFTSNATLLQAFQIKKKKNEKSVLFG
jgi:hypothetical protein